MIERTSLQTAAESSTEAAGSSLGRSLYQQPLTIGLSGALGSGKTAFMRGFLRELGVTTPVTSPTYALEQRYDTPRGEILHIDLYRLDEREAVRALHASDEHPGIRCIEWPERAGDTLRQDIQITITETNDTHRTIDINCTDIDWPDDDTIDAWRTEVRLPPNVGAHCDAVAEFCERAADHLHAQGTFVRRNLVRAAAKAHDLFRFWDFRSVAAPAGYEAAPEDLALWATWKGRYLDAKSHEDAVGCFLRERGFPALAAVAASHSIHVPIAKRTTIEQHLLSYADKRFVGDTPVSVTQRYADFAVRYGNGQRSKENLRWERDALETERLLFPEGAPF